ncbi:MAG: GMC family oxidoreductase [Pirellulaceae bacterium]|nr:GMC family oxidoreductase [Pirellulaceae bacterium]
MTASDTVHLYDYIVIGSGFGGSVSAMRLAEKGYSVAVLEKGKEYRAQDFPKSNWNLRKFLWAPAIRCFGFQKLTFFKQVFILSGVGVGGGSLVYANTHMVPPDEFFHNPSWADFGDWKQRLMPYYDLAKFMLGSVKNQRLDFADLQLRELARDMGREQTFDSVHVGVYFGDPQQPVDPYFQGLGPDRQGCVGCANCMVGCRYNAKNTLDKNYLWFARKFGASLFAQTVVEKIQFMDGVYHVHTRRSTAWLRGQRRVFKSRGLVLSGGVLGTLDLLLKQKHHYRTLPKLSDTLGMGLRTNSEMLCGVQSYHHKLNHGIAISSVFNPDEHTHVEIVKYGDGSDAMGVFGAYAVGPGSAFGRTIQLLVALMTKPHLILRSYYRMLRRTWAKYTIILLVMQSLDSSMRMIWRRRLWRGRMTIDNSASRPVPAHLPIGQQVMTQYAEKVAGIPANSIPEIVFNMSTTAHILGGCPMGADASQGVINDRFQAFGYPNMYILDGSIIQGNLGVNPSLTITALSEYAMSLIAEKEGNKHPSLDRQLEACRAALGGRRPIESPQQPDIPLTQP